MVSRLTLPQVAKRLGICKGRVLRELIRYELLPRPTDIPATWSEDEVAAVERRWAEKTAQMAKKPGQ